MDDQVIHLEQFYVQQNNYKSICKIHVIEHENFKFFAILELRDRRAHLHIEEIIEGINFAFNKIFKTKSIKPENIEYLFEKSIKDLNTYIFDLIKLSEIPIKVTGLHAIIGILLNDQLYLTQRGYNHGFFLFKSKHAEYQLFDILQDAVQDPPEEYIFKEIIQGQLQPGQAIMFGCQSVGNYLTEYNIKRILTLDGITQNTVNAHLKEITNNENFCGILLKSTIVAARSTNRNPVPLTKSEKNSLTELRNTQDRTQNLLTPTLLPKIKDYTLQLYNFLKQFFNSKFSKNKTKHSPVKVTPNSQKPNLNNISYIQKISRFTSSFFTKVVYFFREVIIPTLQNILPKKFKNTLSTNKNSYQSIETSQNIFSLKNTQNKTMLIGIVLIIFAVFMSGFLIKSQRLKNQEQLAYSNLITQIDENFLKAESSLIHKAQERAALHLEEINTLINKLQDLQSIDTTDQVSTYENKINELHNSIYQIRLVRPDKVIDLSQELAQAQVTNIASYNEKLYITSLTKPFLSIVNTKERSVTLLESENETLNLQDITFYERNNNAPFILDSEQNLYQVDTKNNSLLSVSVNFNETKIQDFETYNANIYTLNPSENQIYKHRQISTNNFGRGQSWIKDTTQDISNAQDMIINGSIYILKKDGQIEQYLSGNKTSFSNNINIEPTINSVDSLNYSLSSEKFYVFEKNQKRILVYNNAGDFLYQYHIDIEDEINAISINDENTSILLLAGNKIYEINE